MMALLHVVGIACGAFAVCVLVVLTYLEVVDHYR